MPLISPVSHELRGRIYWFRSETYNHDNGWFCHRYGQAAWSRPSGSAWTVLSFRAARAHCWYDVDGVYPAPVCRAGEYGLFHARLRAYWHLLNSPWNCITRLDVWSWASVWFFPVTHRYQRCWRDWIARAS